MTALQDFLNSQNFISLFLVIGLGYAVGKIKIGGFSLGLGAVLFVGLAVGMIAPKAAPPGLLGLIGLALFMYGIGIQYGGEFMRGLASPFGIRANLLGLVAVLAGCAAAYGMAGLTGLDPDGATGVIAGSMTSTASLHAAMDAAGSKTPAVGYAITYPFGVFGPILCLFLFKRLFRPKIDIPAPQRLELGEARAGDRKLDGLSVADLLTRADEQGVEILAIRREGRNILPDPALTLRADDVIGVAGFPENMDTLDLGAPGSLVADRRDLTYVQAFVSRPGFVGRKISELTPPDGLAMRVIQLRRGDTDVVPRSEVFIEYGDQIGLLVPPDRADEARRFFGDSVEAESAFDFVSFSLGMVLGGLLGLIPVPIPGVGEVSLGIAGGPLIMALILGYFGRIGPFNWKMPLPANLVLRNFGNSIFLASVGMSSGTSLSQNLGANVVSYFISGIVVLLTVVLVMLLVGYFVLRMNFDDLGGIASGSIGNSAILAFGNKIAPTNRPEIVYAMIFPGVGTVVKLIVVQLMVAYAGGAAPPPPG